MGKVATFDLPAPPSVNHYWRKWRNRIVISEKGRLYREHVVAALSPLGIHMKAPIAVTVLYSGQMDLGNLDKALMDAMQHAGIYKDDNEIDDLHFVRVGREGNVVSVEIREIDGTQEKS